MSDTPLLQVIDDFAPAELFVEATKLSAASGWYFGHGSHSADQARFWKMDLDGIVVFDSIWQQTRKRCEELVGAGLEVIRQYANGHTYGLGGKAHVDDSRPGCYTLLYYPMAEWKDDWEGETVFYDERGEVAMSVRPRPNRAVLFDSRILHAGRAPGRACPALRVTVAFKLAVAAVEMLQAAAAEVEVAQGPVKQFTVHIPAAELQQGVAAHLTKLGENVRLPGFRPGKIPMEILESRYGASARTEVVKRLAAQAATKAPAGSFVASIDVSGKDGDLELKVTTVRVSELPAPDFSEITLERLTASDEELATSGVGHEALLQQLKLQVLDHLEELYTFPLPGELVERELAAILTMASADGAELGADLATFRQIAERRGRLGIVVAELARRQQIAPGPLMEEMVTDWLISMAQVEQRAATTEELQDLA